MVFGLSTYDSFATLKQKNF